MKLNPDCLRAVLLEVESGTDADHLFMIQRSDIKETLSDYTYGELLYHIRQCSMSGLIIGLREFDSGEMLTISDLSPAGHEFLSNVRKSTVWDGVKRVATEIGSESVSALTQIAALTVTQLIRSHFGLL